MKTLGLIGGTTWLSTVEYYRSINQAVNARLGGLSSAKLFLYSVDFEEFKPPADAHGWQRIADTLIDIAQRLERAGAECIVLCANTPHRVADDVQARIGIPIVHIVDAVADAISAQQIDCVALLGTKPTMELDFFKARLAKRGIATLVPDAADREIIHASIFAELGKEIFKPETRAEYVRIIDALAERGARGVILGCTEIPLLIRPGDCGIPTFDTTALHVGAAVKFALGDAAPR